MSYPNGKLPPSQLKRSVIGVDLSKDAAAAADSMALAYASKYYTSLLATDGYRPLSVQQELWDGPKHNLAAYPGTSIHGWGDAVDFASGVPNPNSVAHKWMDENAGRYGFVNPAWAKNPNRFEPWHWEKQKRARVRHVINMPKPGQLGYGSRGREVKQLQEDLNKVYAKRGIKLVVDSDFGMATYALLRRFQRARGITARTGVLGPWAKILLARAVRAAR